jgi:hypothetical protein
VSSVFGLWIILFFKLLERWATCLLLKEGRLNYIPWLVMEEISAIFSKKVKPGKQV